MAKTAFIFPGQGSQYVGMGADFFNNFAVAKETYQEADDRLGQHLSRLIFEGPETELVRTNHAQAAIFVTSIALLRTVNSLYPHIKPAMVAGLSLGEYTALVASGRLDFATALELVKRRGELMSQAADAVEGQMAVVLGLDGRAVEEVVASCRLPQDLFAANFNCPGQVVISGTKRGITAGTEALLERGAKRVMPLAVHGAFHSGLMASAREGLAPFIEEAPFAVSNVALVMNVPGAVVSDVDAIKGYLIDQVTHSVRWEEGVRTMVANGVDRFFEIGSGRALTGFNRRIAPEAQSINVDKVADLDQLKDVA